MHIFYLLLGIAHDQVARVHSSSMLFLIAWSMKYFSAAGGPTITILNSFLINLSFIVLAALGLQSPIQLWCQLVSGRPVLLSD
jgi:hypothetical protein